MRILQRRDLVAAGCDRFFEEQVSFRKADRPELGHVRERAALVARKFDRLGRSLRELIGRVNGLKGRGVDFVSLHESIDTTTPGGKPVFHVFGAVAEFERDLILKGGDGRLGDSAGPRKCGRKPVMDDGKIALASKLMRNRKSPVSAACEAVGVSTATLYRYMEADRTPRVEGRVSIEDRKER